jgi:hypothetical protein
MILKTQKTPLKPLMALLLGSAFGLAQANVVSYTTEASFAAALPYVAVDSFDDLAGPLDKLVQRTVGGLSYSVGVGALSTLYGANNGVDGFLSTNAADDVLTFSAFSGNVRGFGGYFFATDMFGGYAPGQSISLSITAADGSASTTLVNPSPDGFIGFVSSGAISQVTLRADAGTLWPTANNVMLASPVPEPKEAGMLLAGLTLLGSVAWLARRSR